MEGGTGSAGQANDAAKLAAFIATRQRGELEQAEGAYLALLEADANNFDALHRLGMLRFQHGHTLLALRLVRRAVELRPDHADAVNHLGEIYQRLGGPADALDSYEEALRLRPDHPAALRNFALARSKLEQYEQSIDAHLRAIDRDPADVGSYYALADVYKEINRFDDALAALRKALAIRPEAAGFRALSNLLYGLGRTEEEAAAYEAWQRADPDDPVPQHLLAACTGKEVPVRASDAFVTREFDRFAETFDEVLGRLEYRAPALVARALRRSHGEARGELDIVDAGCGTGFLAEHLRPFARRLVGVDLSRKMLEKAAARALYDQTIAAELTSFLRASPGSFDVVASADTLVYFGDLREPLAAAAHSLRPGGRLVFTLEQAQDQSPPAEGYRIGRHGRYTHSQPYVLKALSDAAFEVVEIEKVDLRREGHSYVKGLVILALMRAQPGEREANDSAAKLAAAIAMHYRGELEQAEAVYRALLAADANNAEALHYLGVLRYQQGHKGLGIDLVRTAVQTRPSYVDAINNLGNMYHELGGAAGAVQAYRTALELRPDHPGALHNLGIALRKLKRYEEAVDLHRRAIEQAPQVVENYYALANAYKDMGRFDEVLATLRKALEIKPDAEGFYRLGHLLYGLRRHDEAVANYEAWLRFEPESPIAKHMLAACTLKDVPGRAPDAFVTDVFDSFAESFDEVLQGLEYRAPALVGDALRRIDGEPRGDLEVLDAGCGTGLLAPYLRPHARRLVGVDLSVGMLQKAAQRAVYDELVPAELTSYLRSAPQAFDVVASSDTLVYFGNLREVLGAAGASLRPGGRFLFTVEHATEEGDLAAGFRIHAHGRYSHAEPYVRTILADAALEVIDIERTHLRRERGAYVAGLVVAACRRR